MSLLDRFKLDNQVAVVTGGGKGIGEGIAYGLAEAGADVAIVSRTTEQIEKVAEKYTQKSHRFQEWYFCVQFFFDVRQVSIYN